MKIIQKRIVKLKYLKSLFFILIVFFSFLSSGAFSEIINPKDWIVFVKTYETDKFIVNFPVDPKVLAYEVNDKKVISMKAEEKGAEYLLQVSPKISEMAVFDAFEEIKNNDSITLLSHSLVEKEKRKILSYSYKDEKLSKLYKTHIVITEKNIYTFLTSYDEGAEENHQFFTSSFYLEP